MSDKYDHQQIEPKWQKFWETHNSFRATTGSPKPKFYALDMFPYPSGAGLHVGHPVGFTATDIISRKKRMDGYEVLHPMGWDAFGLPAENYAIKTGVHPSESMNANIANFKRQIKSLGLSYDWDREVNTTDVGYYKWSQWLFLQMYHRGLLYEKEMPMNWCPKCKIVAANEEVESGQHERCGADVEKRNLRQWMFRITDYAERLLNDLDTPNIYLLHGWGGTGDMGWFQEFKNRCKTDNIKCFAPDFPKTDMPVYEEWRDHFKAQYPNIFPQDVIITHSLGGGFIQRFLSEESITLDHLVLIAPTVGDCGISEIKNFFETEFDYEAIKKSAKKITLIHSDNDEFITLDEFKFLAEKLDAEVMLFPNRSHFTQTEDINFPEAFALLDEIKRSILDWPHKIKAMQRNWVGRSEGVEIDFKVDGFDNKICVYTTRPDTLFGASYFVLSPEHPLVDELTTEDQWHAIEAYQMKCAAKSDLDRTELNKEKTGVFTGGYVINPINGEKLPVWIADYVLMSYGTGAVMAVPAHDERDHEFATKYDLPIKTVIEGLEDPFQKIGGKIVNSDFLNDLTIEQGISTATKHLEKQGSGYKKVNYKLRDWIFTRQRYWGEPIPFVFDEAGECYALDESELPLELPNTPNYEPSNSGESPLAKITDWVNVPGYINENNRVITKNIPARTATQAFRRETSTMPNWAGSSWYWLRYMDTGNFADFCSKEAEQYWGPVDLYVGGAEHAVLHLLYARFWHKVLFDMGLVSTKEPFKKLVNQGLIMAEDGRKMSKSLGNVVNPDEIVEKFGADTLRCYEMFMGPFEQSKAWNGGAVGGVRKWLDRVWRLFDKIDDNSGVNPTANQVLHKSIKIVGEHIDEFKFNTAISQLMVLTNELTSMEKIPRNFLETLTLLIAPLAPHLAEECWNRLGHTDSLVYEAWPSYEEKYLVEDMVTYAVQINGKLRADFEAEKSAEKSAVIAMAKVLPNVAKYLEEGEIKKEIFVPEKIVGFVVK